MSDHYAPAFFSKLEEQAAGSDWTARYQHVAQQIGDWVVAAGPDIGQPGRIGFYAKPAVWDTILRSVMQITDIVPTDPAFHFTRSFTCPVPVLRSVEIDPGLTDADAAAALIRFAETCAARREIWAYTSFDATLPQDVSNGEYLMTQVIDRLHRRQWTAAREICRGVVSGQTYAGYVLASVDRQAAPDDENRRPSLSFFHLALLWMDRQPSFWSRLLRR